MSLPPSVELALYRYQITKYCKAASLAVLLYDYLITLEDEVDLIWKSRWGLGKALYIFGRYSSLIDMPFVLWMTVASRTSVNTCLRTSTAVLWETMFGIAAAQAILFVRTSALYRNSTRVTVFLFTFWVAVLICGIVITARFIPTIRFTPPPPIFKLKGCFQISADKTLFSGMYLLVVVAETIIIFLTLNKALKTGVPSNSLLQTLYRDSLFHYLFFLVFSVGNVIMLLAGPLPLIELLMSLQRVVVNSILSTRVMIHARSATREKEVTVTELRFAVMSVVSQGIIVSEAEVACEQQPSASESSP